MKNTKMLEMLESGKIEELKKLLREEIYKDSLVNKTDEKKRYTAMLKYFTYVDSARASLQKPYQVEYNNIWYTSFCNSYSLVLTSEVPGPLDMFDSINDGTYPDVARLINCDGDEEELDLTKVFAMAKSKGYKLKKSEVNSNRYLMCYKGTYYRIGLLDITYSIINDGNKVISYRSDKPNRPLTIVNDIGYAVIMPVRIDELDDTMTVIDISEIDA